MTIAEIERAINGYQRGLYLDLEFFHLLASRTAPEEVEIAYSLIPNASREAFSQWVLTHNITPPFIVLGGEGCPYPSVETILAFRSLIEEIAKE